MDRVPGYEPVGRRFESCVARSNEKRVTIVTLFSFDTASQIENLYAGRAVPAPNIGTTSAKRVRQPTTVAGSARSQYRHNFSQVGEVAHEGGVCKTIIY